MKGKDKEKKTFIQAIIIRNKGRKRTRKKGERMRRAKKEKKEKEE